MNKKKNKKIKRILIFGTLCLALDGVILYSYADTWGQIYSKDSEKKTLAVELNNLKEKKEELKSTTEKLKDPEYMAKYAREKRLYSGKGEYIIRIK